MHGRGYLYPKYFETLAKDLNSQELPSLDIEFEYSLLDSECLRLVMNEVLSIN